MPAPDAGNAGSILLRQKPEAVPISDKIKLGTGTAIAPHESAVTGYSNLLNGFQLLSHLGHV